MFSFQAASVGIGIVGKEGKQASLAADFSLTQFSHVAKLILVHGRYSYKRSASLSQFVIHRGLIITTMQVIEHHQHIIPIQHEFTTKSIFYRQSSRRRSTLALCRCTLGS